MDESELLSCSRFQISCCEGCCNLVGLSATNRPDRNVQGSFRAKEGTWALGPRSDEWQIGDLPQPCNAKTLGGEETLLTGDIDNDRATMRHDRGGHAEVGNRAHAWLQRHYPIADDFFWK
jgi:hypothetical protein